MRLLLDTNVVFSALLWRGAAGAAPGGDAALLRTLLAAVIG